VSSPIVGARSEPPNLVAIGASAGGIEPLLTILGGLPCDVPACILVVVHVPESGQSALPRIVSRVTEMPVAHATDGEPLLVGRILIAPPDHHLTVRGGTAAVRRGPTVNRVRPAIDPLFQSVALHAGPRGVGIILSGSLDDGAAGLAAIGEAGGTTIVQEPGEAAHPSMPEAALARAVVQHRLPAAGIAGTVVARLRTPFPPTTGEPRHSRRLEKELTVSQLDEPFITSDELGGDRSVFGCPACGGALWELREDKDFRYRCRVGHAYAPRTLLAAQGANAENGLWIALRALDEQASLAARLADQAGRTGKDLAERRFRQQARIADQHAAAIRDLLRLEPGASHSEEAGQDASDETAASEATAS
jgi:two-component system, chemotaxis family, protein-glutamate methylesterase/glutaminase